MSSVREVNSWQDAYIFCLQPNFQDDLWLFMIFAAIQVSLAGLKLTSFFINRWARGSKVGNGDDDEDNVGDNGASGGISIMGVLTLIAGALILAAYCDDEPDETTFNIFKAGVYLNTFLFAVALIFICGLIVAFVIDILTRRRGRSITFRMFLGGTIVLSITASFFGATGIMGLKYLQKDCLNEVNLYFESDEDSSIYLKKNIVFADEHFFGTETEPTKEFLYENYGDSIIGEPYIFSKAINAEVNQYIFSVVYKTSEYTRKQLMDIKVRTAKFTYNDNGDITGFSSEKTEASCFDTVGGFGEIEGLPTCAIRYSQPAQMYGRYEEAKKSIVDRNGCAREESELECDRNLLSFPLCCNQFVEKYTYTKDCACINSPHDASCGFEKNVAECDYDTITLDISENDQRDYYCDAVSSTTGWCEKTGSTYIIYDDLCKDEGPTEDIYACCKAKDVWSDALRTREWKQYGRTKYIDMIPSACKKFNDCRTSSDFFGGCCKENNDFHEDCKFCSKSPTNSSEEDTHADSCGYKTKCYHNRINIQEQIECCSDVQGIFGIEFGDGTECKASLDYDLCDGENSLACSETTNGCNKDKPCFPECCSNLNFDFATPETIEKSVVSHCFQEASEKIKEINDKDNLLGHYIYHKTGKQGSDRPSCKKVNGIIDPKCCNPDYQYGSEDPCYCFGSDRSSNPAKCAKIHHSKCLPGADAYPQCCFDIGDFFSNDHFCKCRFEENLTGDYPACFNVDTSKQSYEFIDICPNPCQDGKALIDGNSMICELPIFEL